MPSNRDSTAKLFRPKLDLCCGTREGPLCGRSGRSLTNPFFHDDCPFFAVKNVPNLGISELSVEWLCCQRGWHLKHSSASTLCRYLDGFHQLSSNALTLHIGVYKNGPHDLAVQTCSANRDIVFNGDQNRAGLEETLNCIG